MFTAEEVLEYMISTLTTYLIELSDVSDTPDQQFVYGEKLAYVECLEMIEHWKDAKKNGLTFDIEKRFPL